MALVLTIPMALVLAAPMIIAVTFALVIVFRALTAVMVTVALLIARNVFVAVPIVLHKVDALTAGMILAAMLIPMLGMTGRYPHVNRCMVIVSMFNDSRFAIDQHGLREIADIDSTVKARLANADRNTDIVSEGR